MTDDNDANARQTAHGLFQGYTGPDHWVIGMQEFFSAAAQTLRCARVKEQ